jgi:hypothetical protein
MSVVSDDNHICTYPVSQLLFFITLPLPIVRIFVRVVVIRVVTGLRDFTLPLDWLEQNNPQ